MTQSDGWKSPYDPPQGNTPEPRPDQAPAPGTPYGQPPYEQPPYQRPPSEQGLYRQPYEQPYQQPYQPEGAYSPGPYQPQPAPYGAPYGYSATPEKNALGVWSLVLGIVSVVLLFSCAVGFLAAVPAVITGHLSRKANKEGLADNPGLALAGIITGWVTIGLTLLAVVGIGILFTIPEFREGFFGDSGTSYSGY
jgi:hypothetical protein